MDTRQCIDFLSSPEGDAIAYYMMLEHIRLWLSLTPEDQEKLYTNLESRFNYLVLGN